MIRKTGLLLAWLATLLAIPTLVHAQPGYQVLSSCGGVNYPAGPVRNGTQDTTGKLCTSGSGGGGGGAVFGPTAGGSPAANPPVLVGGTVDGTTTGNVENAKVDASHNLFVNCASGCSSAAQTGINVSVTPTIQNASYVSGNCMGGFQTVAMGTTASVLGAISLASQGGLASPKQIYVFSANPSGSTCTDKSTFTLAAADTSKLIATFSLSPTAPAGTTRTFASQNNLGLGIPSGGTFYVAIVETVTETPTSTTDLVLNASGF